jgi:hypothetical protein
MKPNQYVRQIYLLLALSLAGCAGNGYISSSVNTVLGLDVSENPKTQVPHVKFGYARSGLYYVPTGKTETKSGSIGSGSAAETPTVVSEIFVHSKFLTDITISEKFAIGPGAVSSPAATQTFASNSAQAVAANGAVQPTIVQPVVMPQPRERRSAEDSTVKALKSESTQRAEADEVRAQLYSKLDAVVENKKSPDFYTGVMTGAPGGIPRNDAGLTRYVNSEKDPEKLKAIKSRIEPFAQ